MICYTTEPSTNSIKENYEKVIHYDFKILNAWRTMRRKYAKG